MQPSLSMTECQLVGGLGEPVKGKKGVEMQISLLVIRYQLVGGLGEPVCEDKGMEI